MLPEKRCGEALPCSVSARRVDKWRAGGLWASGRRHELAADFAEIGAFEGEPDAHRG